MISFKELEDIKLRSVEASSDVIRLIKELERVRGCCLRIENLRMDHRDSDLGDFTLLNMAEELAREGLGV